MMKWVSWFLQEAFEGFKYLDPNLQSGKLQWTGGFEHFLAQSWHPGHMHSNALWANHAQISPPWK